MVLMRSLRDKMKPNIWYIIIILFLIRVFPLTGQVDEDPPVSPIFTFITVNPINGRTEMEWTPSPDDDVAKYVIYKYIEGEGYAIDTIFDPTTTRYDTLWPYTDRSESFVIAAVDYSENISPLSNELHTIYTELVSDTCNNRIHIYWNKYSSVPIQVTGYEIEVSVNNGPYQTAGNVSGDSDNFIYEGIGNDTEYCYRVNAFLENGRISGSNTACALIEIQSPPQWINADFATITDEGAINLSFTIDESGETDLFALERRTGYSGSFEQISLIRTSNNTISYFDTEHEPDAMNFYRLSGLNNCSIPVVYSNIASNMVLSAQNTGSEIILQWNKYREWNGSVESYRLFTDTGSGFSETALIEPSDTVFRISISDIMYSLAQNRICFYVTATETGNPYGIRGESRSNQICSEIEEVITVPNVFTPDNDLKNDLFRPVLTFKPSEYRLIISDRKGKIIFETDDFLEEWDGSFRGAKVSEGVYLWFLRIVTSSGRSISRTGTVTVVKN